MIRDQPTIDVTLKSGDKPVLLAELRSAIDDFQAAFGALAENLSASEDVRIDFEVIGAHIGSLSLQLRPVPPPAFPISTEALVSTFESDLRGIGRNQFRPGLSAPLVDRYRCLVKGLQRRALVAELSFGNTELVIDPGFQRSFEASFKERVAVVMEIVGQLDAIRAHSPPYVFFPYPKLAGLGNIERRFPEAMLDLVRPMLKKLARVQGRASFGPVGVYPGRIEVSEPPVPAEYSKEALLARIGSLNQMAVGQTDADYLAKNREEAGLAD